MENKNPERSFKGEGHNFFFDKIHKGSWSDAVYMHVKHHKKGLCFIMYSTCSLFCLSQHLVNIKICHFLV